jgi:catechol 2,3-dioxygenase-like lactoylglutathione lyase family enzyme
MATRLGIVILAVDDVEASTRFYRDTLQLPQTVSAPAYSEFLLEHGERFGVYQREGFSKNTRTKAAPIPSGTTAPSETYFYVDDPRAVSERLERAGAKLLSELVPRAWGDEAAYYADPDGHVIVIARSLS